MTTPTFIAPGGNREVRIYSTPYFDEDPEDEVHQDEAFSDASDELDAEQTDSLLLTRNLAYLDSENASWTTVTQTSFTSRGDPVILIVKPAASKLNYKCLHPSLYRNVRNVGSLDDLAVCLGAPSNWEQQYNDLVDTERSVRFHFDCLRALSDGQTEATVEVTLELQLLLVSSLVQGIKQR